MAKGVRVTVTWRPVKYRDIPKAVRGASKNAASLTRKWADDIATFTVSTMKSEVPVRTGRLRSSIKVRKRYNSITSRKSKVTRVIAPDTRYLKFVLRGTGPSPKMFHPVIMKRINRGFHPGTPKNQFVDRTQSKVATRINETKGKLRKSMGKQFVKSFYLGGRR